MSGIENCQESGESIPQSFIVKIQNNKDGTCSNPAGWHVQITHVMSGKKVVFKGVKNIKTFIWPFLQELDVERQPDWLKTNG